MIILVINCGSSSIKYQLLDMKSDDVFDLIAKGIAEKIGLPAGILQYAPTGRDKIVKDIPIPDHKVGMQLILQALTDPGTGVLHSLEDIEAVGHRIVQGGDFFAGSALVNDDVIDKITFCCDFAPLHNPAHLLGIRAIQEVLPAVPQVVTFDTAFLMPITTNTASAATAPTALRTSLSPQRAPSLPAWTLTRPKSSPATWAQAVPSAPSTGASASTHPWASPRWRA